MWRTVAYGDIFSYPLTFSEIHRYLEGETMSQSNLQALLDQSKALAQRLEESDGYYCLRGRSALVDHRLQRESAARPLTRSAKRYASWIARLVRDNKFRGIEWDIITIIIHILLAT